LLWASGLQTDVSPGDDFAEALRRSLVRVDAWSDAC
jgi:hypothetical protein